MILGLNNLDIIIIVIYAIFIIHGFNKGFFNSLLSLGIVAGAYFGTVFLNKFLLTMHIPFINKDHDIVFLIALFFVLIFVGLYIKSLLFGHIDKIFLFSVIDKILGTLLGFLKGTLIVFGICYILMFFSTTTFVKDSKLFPYIEHYSSMIIKNVK